MFEAKFASASLLKKIIEAIKDLVTDAPFDCTEHAMCLQAMDGSHVALVSLKLEIGLFETYRCDRTISLGLSLTEMSKIFKCSKNDDTCMIRFMEGDGDSVAFSFEDNKGRKQDITLKLMDIDNEHLGIPDQKYACVIEMPSAEFQKTCRDIASFSDTMNVTATKAGVVFSGSGDAVTNTITYSKEKIDEDDEDSNRIDITVKEKVNVHFSIKYLVNFTKASTISDRVRISLCNRVPIVVEYDIQQSGYLRFYLAPKIDEDQEKEKNAANAMDDDE